MLHLQIEVLDQVDVGWRVVALCVLYAQCLDRMSGPFPREGHQDALGLAALHRNNNRLPCGKESMTGCTDGHIVSAVIGNDY